VTLLPGKFVVFAQGRTGSTLLGDLLGQHPEVYFGHEVLQQRVPSPRVVIERMRFRHARHVVGFHVKIYQLTDTQRIANPHAWLRNLNRCGWSVVALRRENVLRHVLSNMTAIAGDRYDDRSGAPSRVTPTVDVDDLLTWMRRRVELGRDEAAVLDGIPHLSLTYEDDLQDASSWPATTERVFSFLDLPPAPVTSTLSRLNSGALADLIANHAEIKAALTGTEFARYLD
jgi:hypothetical protein